MANNFFEAQHQLVETGKWLASKGWSPATSSNYSLKFSEHEIAITRSGVDKAFMIEEDVILINPQGQEIDPRKGKTSAETLIHTTLYELFPEARCVLHTHSVIGTRLSMKFTNQKQLAFEGYELLKGLERHSTHEAQEVLPIIKNSQDMPAFARNLKAMFNDFPKAHGFLIEGHGLYTWAKNLKSCKRQIETFEFLMECKAYETLGL